VSLDFVEPPDPLRALRTADVFRDLPEDTLRELAAEMTDVRLADGDVLIRRDDHVDHLYVVLSGGLSVLTHDRHGAQMPLPALGPGRIVGEMNLLSAGAALVSVEARGPADVAALSRAGFERFSARCPDGAVHFIEALRPLLRRHRLWIALHQSDTFRQLDAQALLDFEAEFQLVSLYGGQVVVREGDGGDDLWIVVSGRLRVVTTGADGAEVAIAELGTGETVGEMALVSGDPRSATVYAIRDTQLAKLSKTAFYRLLERHPRETFAMVTTRLVARLRERRARHRHSVATIAVVPSGPGAPTRAAAERLSAAFSRLDRTRHLTSDIVDRDLSQAGGAQAYDLDGGSARLLEWLAGQEVEHRFIIYEADAGLSPWTERCVRQADHVVIVADVSGDATPGEIETELLRSRSVHTRQTLALVYPGRHSTPSSSARWLTGRTIERHLHLCLDDAGDFDRLARLLAGKAVGLALGGGFARGLAHVGVLRALRELNIPVDLIGGSSMGAMVGAQWALGWEGEHIVSRTAEGLRDSFDDMTLPFLSFKRGGKHSRMIRRFFGETRIEDLWQPYFCVSTNLNRAEVKVHSSGSLADAVLASTRAPGIFPPVVMDGELHVDGGLINNVPVDIMRTFSNGGIVIGVDVSPPHELNPVSNYGDEVSGWRAVWRRFNPDHGKRVYHPSILLVLMRVIEFGGISYRRQKAESADLYISPELLKFKRNDFHIASEIAEAGYRAAHEALTAWLARRE